MLSYEMDSGSEMTFRMILRDLPRKKVALVLLLLLSNLAVVGYSHGSRLGRTRAVEGRLRALGNHNEGGVWTLDYLRRATPFAPPWTWSVEDWTDLRAWDHCSPNEQKIAVQETEFVVDTVGSFLLLPSMH